MLSAQQQAYELVRGLQLLPLQAGMAAELNPP